MPTTLRPPHPPPPSSPGVAVNQDAPTANANMDANAMMMSQQEQDQHDATQSSISAQDVLYLLRYRFLDVLVLDLQHSAAGADSADITSNHHQQDKLPGAYALHSLAGELRRSPNAVAAVYAVVCHEGLRRLLARLSCPFLICYDERGYVASCVFRGF